MSKERAEAESLEQSEAALRSKSVAYELRACDLEISTIQKARDEAWRTDRASDLQAITAFRDQVRRELGYKELPAIALEPSAATDKGGDIVTMEVKSPTEASATQPVEPTARAPCGSTVGASGEAIQPSVSTLVGRADCGRSVGSALSPRAFAPGPPSEPHPSVAKLDGLREDVGEAHALLQRLLTAIESKEASRSRA